MKKWEDVRARAGLDEARVAEQRAEMIAQLELVEPASTFSLTPFWRRMERLSAERGHDGHPTMLLGVNGTDDRYALRCTRCDETLVRMRVDRDA